MNCETVKKIYLIIFGQFFRFFRTFSIEIDQNANKKSTICSFNNHNLV